MAYNLVYGFLKGGIDNGAHLGGLSSGVLAGIFLSGDLWTTCRTASETPFVFSGSVVVLVLAFGLVRHLRVQPLVIESARQDLARGLPDVAIGKLAPLAAC